MPIAGLTDRAASFPRIGVLRKGAAKVSDRQPGKDLTHFRFDTDDDQAAAQFAEAYGAEPRAIRIYLPYDGVEENFVTWQEHWAAGGLMHRCDGVTCVMRRTANGSGYDRSPAPCPHINLPKDHRDRCKPVGRLSVIIPELKRLAYVTVLTHSIHDIISLTEQLSALSGVAGRLRGIPMILRRTEREISMPDGKGGRVRRAKWLLSIEAAPHWVGLQLEAQERAALPPAAAQPLALPAPQGATYDAGGWADEDEAVEPPARPPLPPAPPVNEHGEVIEDAPDRVRFDGPITDAQARFNAKGELVVRFSLDGQEHLIVKAPEDTQFIEPGDVIRGESEWRTIRGKPALVVIAFDGDRDADGDTPWQARASEAAVVVEEGATFDAVAEPAL